MSHIRLLGCFALLFWGLLMACSPTPVVGRVEPAPRAAVTGPTYLLIRSDDAGISTRRFRLPDMSKNRQGELDALTSQRFSAALEARNTQLLTYRQLIHMHGLQAMRRPGG